MLCVFLFKSHLSQLVNKKCLSKRDLECVRREANVWAATDHPNIVRLFQVIDSPNWMCFVSELCTGGELFDQIIVSHRIPEDAARVYFRQVLSAVHHCHTKGFAHRDLKPVCVQ